jgi:hypothetical protein
LRQASSSIQSEDPSRPLTSQQSSSGCGA